MQNEMRIFYPSRIDFKGQIRKGTFQIIYVYIKGLVHIKSKPTSVKMEHRHLFYFYKICFIEFKAFVPAAHPKEDDVGQSSAY